MLNTVGRRGDDCSATALCVRGMDALSRRRSFVRRMEGENSAIQTCGRAAGGEHSATKVVTSTSTLHLSRLNAVD